MSKPTGLAGSESSTGSEVASDLAVQLKCKMLKTSELQNNESKGTKHLCSTGLFSRTRLAVKGLSVRLHHLTAGCEIQLGEAWQVDRSFTGLQA